MVELEDKEVYVRTSSLGEVLCIALLTSSIDINTLSVMWLLCSTWIEVCTACHCSAFCSLLLSYRIKIQRLVLLVLPSSCSRTSIPAVLLTAQSLMIVYTLGITNSPSLPVQFLPSRITVILVLVRSCHKVQHPLRCGITRELG